MDNVVELPPKVGIAKQGRARRPEQSTKLRPFRGLRFVRTPAMVLLGVFSGDMIDRGGFGFFLSKNQNDFLHSPSDRHTVRPIATHVAFRVSSDNSARSPK